MKNLYIRLPDDLHERVMRLAEREKRSLNKQVEVMLERGAREAESRDCVRLDQVETALRAAEVDDGQVAAIIAALQGD